MRKDLIPNGRLNKMSIFNEFDSVFDDLFSRIAPVNQQNTYPVSNIYINADDILVFEFALAGFNKDEIGIEIEDNILRVSAEKQTSEDHENKYIIRRFAKRAFSKQYNIADLWDMDSIETSFVDGVLELFFYKKIEI